MASASAPLAQLLHRADELVRAFNSHHASSFNSVQTISSACSQLQNLLSLPQTPVTRSRPEGGIRERGMAKVQETIEESLQAIREGLAKMEQDVELIKQLLFEADLFLSTPSLALQHGLNPKEALQHVSSLYHDYSSEMIRLRSVVTCWGSEAHAIHLLTTGRSLQGGVGRFHQRRNHTRRLRCGMADDEGSGQGSGSRVERPR